MNRNDWVASLRALVNSEILTKFTIIPATVTATPSNYENKPFVDVKPSIRKRRGDNSTIEPTEYLQVPLFMLSTNGGIASVSMPIKTGDNVLLLYSMLDTQNYLVEDGSEVQDADFRDHISEYPICAIPSLYTYGNDNSPEVDPNNIVIKNNKSILTHKPSGDIIVDNDKTKLEILNSGTTTFTNDKVTVVANNDGTVSINNGSGSFTLQPSGDIDANGCTINTSGNVITASGADLDALKQAYNSHEHTTIAIGSPTTPTDTPA